MRTTIIVADKSAEVRKAFSGLLSGTPYEVVGEATDGDALFEAIDLLKPWAIAIDLLLPGHANKPGDGGNSLVKKIADKYPKLKVLILHSGETVHLVMGAISLSNGVRVRKPLQRDKVLEAFTQLATGQDGVGGAGQMGVKLKKALLMSYKNVNDGFFTKKREAMTTDLSETGISIQTEEKLAKGAVLNIELDLPGEAPLKAKMQAIRVEPLVDLKRFDVGLNFVELAQAEKERLKAFTRRLMERGTNVMKPGL